MVLAVLFQRRNHPSLAVTVEVNCDIACLLYASLLPYGNRTQPLRSEWFHPEVGAVIFGLLILEVLFASKSMCYGVIAICLDIVKIYGDLHTGHIPSLEEILGLPVFLLLIR